MKRLTTLLAIALASVLLPVSAAGAQVEQIHPSYVALASDVVTGTVGTTNTIEVDGDLYRIVELHVTSAEIGSQSGTVLIASRGGERSDGAIVQVSHQPEFDAGETVHVPLYAADEAVAAKAATLLSTDLPVFAVVGGADGVVRPFGTAHGAGENDYVLIGPRWTDPTITYQINPAHSGLPAAATRAAVQRAFARWQSDPLSDVSLNYGGQTTKSGINIGDGVTVVSWVNGPANGSPGAWIAQATYAYTENPVTRERTFIEVDIRVNTNYAWADGAVSGRFDIETALSHEVGHGLGLDHTTARSELMYKAIAPNTTKPLGAGDRAGLAALYPTRDDLCAGEVITVDLNAGGTPTEGRDVILGTDQADWIYALGGDDVICGGGGIDRIFGGLGNDVIHGEGGSDRIYGQEGNDEIVAGSGADRVWGGPGNDSIFGSGGQDFIWGEDGNDVIQGNWESDRIWGGNGDDQLFGAAGKDKLYGEAGNDSLNGGVNTDYLNGGTGHDVGNGQKGSDRPLVAGVSGCEQLAQAVSC